MYSIINRKVNDLVLKAFPLVVFITISLQTKAQNLVPNPSFEDANCPTSYTGFPAQVAQYFNYWYSANCASADPMSTCSNHANTTVPNVLFGNTYANTGNNYMGFGFYSGWYEYFGTQLTQPLTAGTTYDVSFYVRCAQTVGKSTDQLGIYFSSTQDSCAGGFGGPVFSSYTPQVVSPAGTFLNDTSQWVQISGSFIASGGEEYLVFGCFEDWTSPHITTHNASAGTRCYYYVDDISITQANTGPVPNQPLAITGDTVLCVGDSLIYSVVNDTAASSYTWTLPTDWIGTSDSNSIEVVVGNLSGTISITANDSNGSSTPQTLQVVVDSIPSSPVFTNNNPIYCWGDSVQLQVQNDPSVSQYNWSFPLGWTGNSDSNKIQLTLNQLSDTLQVSAENQCGISSISTLNVTVDSIPNFPGPILGDTTICSGDTVIYSANADTTIPAYFWTFPNGWSGSSFTDNIQLVANNTSGIITVRTQNHCGFQTDSLLVEVSIIPEPKIINGDALVCTGDVVTYTISPESNVSYSWFYPQSWSGFETNSNLEITFSNISGSIQLVGSNECGLSDTSSLDIIVTSIDTIIYANDSSLLIQLQSGATYNWIDCNTNQIIIGETGQEYTPETSGSYAAIITSNGCIDTTACIDFTVKPNGISSINSANWSVYPNPANNELYIESESTITDVIQVELIDLTGKVVYQQNWVNQTSLAIQTNHLPNGLYFININGNTIQEKLKIVISH